VLVLTKLAQKHYTKTRGDVGINKLDCLSLPKIIKVSSVVAYLSVANFLAVLAPKISTIQISQSVLLGNLKSLI
jgi:hypothetical protein